MEQQLEVMRRILELSETCIEGLEHIRTRLYEGYMQEILYLVEDVLYAFCQIDFTLKVLKLLPEIEEITDVTVEVENALSDLLYEYEQQDINAVIVRLNHELLPTFRLWNQKMYLFFNPHILS